MLIESIPFHELASRWDRSRKLLQQFIPQARGILVFSRLNIYYFTGSFANGVFWLPVEGDPVFFCRRGIARCRIESPAPHIHPFTSYRDIETIMSDLGFSLPEQIAAEMNGLSWALANTLTKHLFAHQFVPADKILGMCRARKSAWELAIIREAGSRHARCLTELLPPFLHEGMSELEISHKISDIFFSEGHHGILRMESYGEEAFLGHIAVGDSANYPSVFNGPVGLRGVHPATPYMGSSEIKWTAGHPLTIDNGFTLAGYMTDKTQVYWLGTKKTIPADGRAAHDFCIGLQDQIAELLRPGTLPSRIWSHCLGAVENSRWSEGFMGLGGNKVFFVGHGIGLAIDEYPVLTKGFDLPLEEGMTLAIEPKIGIPDFGMVGVENTFEVTSNGGKSLTGRNSAIITV
ncbi:MAG: Xaa-Pro peptidase family protein [Desulfobulbaceae bacterium]|nr:Xaa-Pro peptidase family protein [Desulfobulbaceae bacterium]